MSEHISIIPSNPVAFSDGVALPPNLKGDMGDPQNLWASIEMNSAWTGANVLGIAEPGVDSVIDPYVETTATSDVRQLIKDADTKRITGERYADLRNLESLAAFLGLQPKEFGELYHDFEGKSVLDIGSGGGAFSDDIRRESQASATELDFSFQALRGVSAGAKILADGTCLPVRDSVFDSSVSMFSTSVHADTLRSRLSGLTEMLRVTKDRAFVVPLFADMILRQQRWFTTQSRKSEPGYWHDEMQDYEQVMRREAAMDYAMTDLLRQLMIDKVVEFTPILVREQKEDFIRDCISGVFDINRTLGHAEATDLIEASVSQFSRPQ